MHTEHIDTLIIGAGQAGLATGFHLQRRGRRFLIVDGNGRVGDGWREQWDSLKLYSPAKYDALPGLRFPASAWSFPAKDDVADYLESYVAAFGLPVRLGTRIEHLEARGNGYLGYGTDIRIEAQNVVVATGTFGRTPYVPELAEQLDPSIRQLHSSDYRRPSQLAPGPVLVVGGSHSGGDIALEAALTHATILCGRDTGQIPVTLRSPLFRVVYPVVVFAFRHLLTRRTPIGRRQMEHFRFHGGPALRVQAADLARMGVERVPDRVTGVRDGRPMLAGGRVVPAATVVWATGFRQVFDWIDVPVFGADGWPREVRGVVEESPGLHFCGLGFQYAASSMLIAGVGRDAAYVARRIARHHGTTSYGHVPVR